MSLAIYLCELALVGATESTPADSDRVISAWSLFLLVGLILVLLVLVGSSIMVRSSRRRRAVLDRRPPIPTASEDVWAMHRLEDGWEESIEDQDDYEDENRKFQ